MLEALLLHLLAIPVFGLQLLRAVPAEGWRHAWKRIPLFGLIWTLFSLLNLLHIIGHLADEVLFSKLQTHGNKKAGLYYWYPAQRYHLPATIA